MKYHLVDKHPIWNLNQQMIFVSCVCECVGPKGRGGEI